MWEASDVCLLCSVSTIVVCMLSSKHAFSPSFLSMLKYCLVTFSVPFFVQNFYSALLQTQHYINDSSLPSCTDSLGVLRVCCLYFFQCLLLCGILENLMENSSTDRLLALLSWDLSPSVLKSCSNKMPAPPTSCRPIQSVHVLKYRLLSWIPFTKVYNSRRESMDVSMISMTYTYLSVPVLRQLKVYIFSFLHTFSLLSHFSLPPITPCLLHLTTVLFPPSFSFPSFFLLFYPISLLSPSYYYSVSPTHSTSSPPFSSLSEMIWERWPTSPGSS